MRYFLLILAALALITAACDISSPRLPAWNVDLNVPLTNQRLYVADLADSVNIIVGDGQILTLTGTGDARTNPFGEVNFTPNLQSPPIPLLSGVTHSGAVPIEDPEGKVFLSYGRLEEGTLKLNFENMHPGITSLSLTFPDIRTAQGESFVAVYPGGSGMQTYSLVGCSIGVDGSGIILNELAYILDVQSDQPDGTPVGTVTLLVNNQLGFNIFQGRLLGYRRDFTGEISPIDIDYPHNMDTAVQLQEANLLVRITNEIGFEAEFHGEIFAKNYSTLETRSIDVMDSTEAGLVPYMAAPATAQGPTVTEHNFSRNLNQLLQIMPDYVELRNAYLLINSLPGQLGFVCEDDREFVRYRLDAPFKMVILDSVIEMGEPRSVDISSDIQKQIREKLLTSDLCLEVLNKVPVGGTGTIYIGTDPDLNPANPQSWSFSKAFTVHASTSPGGDQPQQIEISLSKEEVDVFANPTVYMILSFHFEPSNGVVEITAGPEDYVEVKAMLRAKVLVDVEED